MDVANGPGGGGGGPLELPPPQPMMRLMMQISPNPKDGRKSLLCCAKQRDNRAARALKRLRGQSGFDPERRKKKPTRLRAVAFGIGTAVAEGDGDRVSVAFEVAPLERFTVDGCSEQL